MEPSKRRAFRLFFLALAFTFFFEETKHRALLAAVNPFAEDPYDAVSSIAVQLVWFLAMLSILRAFRPRSDKAFSAYVSLLQSRAEFLGACAVCLSLLADIVALVRHHALWSGTRGGAWLATMTSAGMLVSLVALVDGWRAILRHDERLAWRWMLASTSFSFAALALYPEQLLRTVPGSLTTALAGIALLYLPLAGIACSMRNTPEPMRDLVDDLLAIGESCKWRVPQLRPIYVFLDRLQRNPWAVQFARWINPRQHRWRGCLLLGAATGLALVSLEIGLDPPSHIAMAALLIAVFVGLESAAVFAGYALLEKPLGLFRSPACESHLL